MPQVLVEVSPLTIEEEELASVHGVGEVTAKAIIDYFKKEDNRKLVEHLKVITPPTILTVEGMWSPL